MYKALDLSKYIVSKCMDEGHPVSNLQLQKILYYIQREYLQNGSIAFYDDIEAWQFGPVVPSVYYEFCGYGAMPITRSYYNTEVMTADKSTIDKLIISKRALNPWDLVEETHRIGGAWDQVYKNGEGNHRIIPTELIKVAG